jgi:hypothetical protein
VPLQQKTTNFKVAIPSRTMQWRAFTEENQKNQLAKTEFQIRKTIIIIITRAVVHTGYPSRPHQRCTAAKEDKRQVGLFQQIDAVECIY